MAFLTPCFVRVEDPAERNKLIEWLEEIGYNVTDRRYGNYVISAGGKVYMAVIVCASKPFIDCGTSVELFRALSAMNDENDREQWFVDAGRMFKCYRDKLYRFAYLAGRIRKATAEEIVEYFKKK